MGLVTPTEYVQCWRAGVSACTDEGRATWSRRGTSSRPVPRRVGGDALVHRGARGGGLQMGLDPGAEPRPLRPPDRLLDPHLHPPRDGLSARNLRRQLPHRHAHGRLVGSIGEVARAQGFEDARDRRGGPYGGGDASHVQRGLRLGAGPGLEPVGVDARPLRRRAAAEVRVPDRGLARSRADGSCSGRRRDGHAGARPDRDG